MKKRIAILQNGFIRGGSERFVINLCKGLPKEDYDITIINPATDPELQVLEPEVLQTGATILHTTTLHGLTGRLRHLWRLHKILHQGHYDIFQTNLDLFNGPNLLIAWLERIPIRCCHSHATMQETEIRLQNRHPGAFNPLNLLCRSLIKSYQHIMRQLCWTFANRHVGCSDEANDFLYKGHNWRKQPYPTVIFNGIDLKKYQTEAKSDLPLDPDKRYILSVNRFEPQKNPSFILDLMQHLQTTRPDIELLWVGKGTLYEDIKQQATDKGLTTPYKGDKRGAIHFLGWRDDVHALMQHSHLLLMPSLYEGLSITLIEAQASGLPCLVSDTITPQAQCGLVRYKSLNDSIDDWCNTITSILGNDTTLQADQDKLNQFSIRHLAHQMIQLFRS